MKQDKQYPQEIVELFDKFTKALKQASLEARKVAIQTNTNLVIYDPQKGIQKIPASELAKG